MKKSALTYLVLLLLSSCIYPFSVEKGDAEFSDIVVSGDILIGEQSRIQLGYVFPVGTFPTEMRRDFPTGSLTIENEDGGRWRGEYQSRGLYVFDTSDAPTEGRYRLHIIINDGAEYVSEWMGVHQAPAIHNLNADCDGEYVNISMDLEGADSLWNFRWDYNQTWEYHADYYPDLMFVPGLPEKDRENPEKIYRLPTPEEDYYYCWTSAPSVEPGLASAEGQSINSVKNARVLSISCTDMRISTLYCIDVTASGISAGGRAYLQHMHDISNETGSLFSPTPSEMTGNIRCISDPTLQAIGYIDAVCRTTARLFIGPEYYHMAYDPEQWLFYPEPDEDGMYNFDHFFGYASPVSCPDTPTKTNVKWGPKRCVDCRELKGSKNKPDWWPNDHK